MYFTIFQEARGCLEKTIYWLEQEPEVLPEGQLLIQAKLNISEMEKTLESVHRLTSSIPAMWSGRTTCRRAAPSTLSERIYIRRTCTTVFIQILNSYCFLLWVIIMNNSYKWKHNSLNFHLAYTFSYLPY